VGLIAAGLAAVDPLSVAFSASVLSETAFTLALMVALWIGLNLMEGARFWWWVLLGLVWGIGVYLRASALWCLVPIAIVIACSQPSTRRRAHACLGALCAILLVFLVLLPWQLRNYQHFGDRYFRLTTLEGISLYEAVYPEADGGPKQDKIPLPPEMASLNEAQRNDEWSRRAWQEIREYPARTASLAVRKVARTWTPFLNAGEFQNPLIQSAMGLWHIPLFILALIGVSRTFPRNKMTYLLLAPVMYFTLIHALFLGSVRYRVPLMPLVCIFAAAGVVWTLERFRARFRPQRAAEPGV
jgi:hypothetical protein